MSVGSRPYVRFRLPRLIVVSDVVYRCRPDDAPLTQFITPCYPDCQVARDQLHFNTRGCRTNCISIMRWRSNADREYVR